MPKCSACFHINSSPSWINEPDDCATTGHYSEYLGATTISGKPVHWKVGFENRIEIKLDCDNQRLEFRFVKDDKSFWELSLPKKDKKQTYYAFAALYCRNSWVRFCDR